MPLVVGSDSPFVACVLTLRSVTGLLNAGGPMGGGADGVTSMGSLAAGAGSDAEEEEEEDGRIGMDLRMFGAKWSGENEERWKDSVAAMWASTELIKRNASGWRWTRGWDWTRIQLSTVVWEDVVQCWSRWSWHGPGTFMYTLEFFKPLDQTPKLPSSRQRQLCARRDATRKQSSNQRCRCGRRYGDLRD